MTHEIPLGPGREFDAIRELLARLGDAASGVGDDAAILDVPRGERIVVSTDASVENRHFRDGWLDPQQIGYRAVTAALSDVAAMAARPLAILWSVNLPDRWRAELPRLADGVAEASRAVGAPVVGGNVTASEELSITTTVIGSAYQPLRRAGARPGDTVYVTGRLGGPALALAALSAGRLPDDDHRARFARPVARIAEARWLADRGATAMIDVSDGVAGDARHLAAASGAAIVIHLDRLPAVRGADPFVAVRGGEEYELLLSGPPQDVDAFEQRFDLPLTAIGEVARGEDAVFLEQGRRVEVGGGHDHFSR